MKVVRDETALKECDDSHDMSYDEKLLKMRKDCQNYFDDNLGKLDKKVKELSNLFDAAFALKKEFDKTRKNVEAIADGYCKIGTTNGGVSEDVEVIGTKICGVYEDIDVLQRNQEKGTAKISDISEDLAELVTFVDNVANKFNLHDVSLPMVRGTRNIKIKR